MNLHFNLLYYIIKIFLMSQSTSQMQEHENRVKSEVPLLVPEIYKKPLIICIQNIFVEWINENWPSWFIDLMQPAPLNFSYLCIYVAKHTDKILFK